MLRDWWRRTSVLLLFHCSDASGPIQPTPLWEARSECQDERETGAREQDGTYDLCCAGGHAQVWDAGVDGEPGY